jgi:hypothetical protein
VLASLLSGCCSRACSHLADSPPGRCGQSAWTSWPRVLCVLHVFLCAFRSIHFVSGFLLHEVHGRSVLECRTVRVGADGPRAHRRRPVIEGAVLEVWGLFSDGPS